jgi:hypothetical protein
MVISAPFSICWCRNAAALPQYVKAFARKGQALQGLGRHREAAATFEAGLQVVLGTYEQLMQQPFS